MGWMTYQYADKQLQGRCKASRKLENHTYLIRHCDSIAVRFHNTDIVTFYPDGNIEIHCGGYFDSPTTKSRIQEYAPVGWIYSDRIGEDRFRCIKIAATVYQYKDGLTIRADGTVDAEKWDRQAELDRRAIARGEIRERIKALKAEAAKAFRAAGYGHTRISIPLRDQDNPVWVEAWLKGQIAIHAALHGYRSVWNGLFTVSHESGIALASGHNIPTSIRIANAAHRIEDQIGGYLTLEKIGASNSKMYTSIMQTLRQAA